MEFQLDGRDVGIDGFIEQAGLRRIELFTAPAKLPALKDCHLVRELVDLGLAVFDLAVLAGDGLVTLDYLHVTLGDLPVTLANPGHQSRDHFA